MSAQRHPFLPNWDENLPRGVLDPNGPDGEPIDTPQDHRLLWHIEGELAILATTDSLRHLQRVLKSYLNETCHHHWRAHSEFADIPAHRQCLWCNDVEWLESSDV